MEETEAITPEEKQTAANSDLALSNQYLITNSYSYPYYFDSVLREAQLVFGLDEQDVLNNGYTIYTALNQEQQQ